MSRPDSLIMGRKQAEDFNQMIEFLVKSFYEIKLSEPFFTDYAMSVSNLIDTMRRLIEVRDDIEDNPNQIIDYDRILNICQDHNRNMAVHTASVDAISDYMDKALSSIDEHQNITRIIRSDEDVNMIFINLNMLINMSVSILSNIIVNLTIFRSHTVNKPIIDIELYNASSAILLSRCVLRKISKVFKALDIQSKHKRDKVLDSVLSRILIKEKDEEKDE